MAAHPQGAIFTDLDGTLLTAEAKISDSDRAALDRAASRSILRVAITGRSLYSAKRVLDALSPIDFLVTSSGAAIYDWRTGDLIKSHIISSEAAQRGIKRLIGLNLDFMIQKPVPRNHHLAYHRATPGNHDFDRRLLRYEQFSQKLDLHDGEFGPATQFLIVMPPQDDAARRHQFLTREFTDFSVIRSTSPLDGKSTWFEVFPAAVSKKSAAAWICDHASIPSQKCMAIGNDYNDLSLLEWCPHSYVVENAPKTLRDRFCVVPSNEQSGVSRAISFWVSKISFHCLP